MRLRLLIHSFYLLTMLHNSYATAHCGNVTLSCAHIPPRQTIGNPIQSTTKPIQPPHKRHAPGIHQISANQGVKSETPTRFIWVVHSSAPKTQIFCKKTQIFCKKTQIFCKKLKSSAKKFKSSAKKLKSTCQLLLSSIAGILYSSPYSSFQRASRAYSPSPHAHRRAIRQSKP